jgi:hypothetical protein
MRAIARDAGGLLHEIETGGHRIVSDGLQVMAEFQPVQRTLAPQRRA